ncbi:MAG: hypothetical protein IT342_05805 [Candidatus Melainabacteria bacterium]|nr:hypothetical protein [Candidatus Melainabacteria bacterium]
MLSSALALACMVGSGMLLSSCGSEMGTDAELSKNVYMELVDWHISGLWVINCPVAWMRVLNYNSVPVKNPKVSYATFDFEGKRLSSGTYVMEGEVPAGQVKNFIEQYLGLVDLHSDKLAVKFIGVERE